MGPSWLPCLSTDLCNSISSSTDTIFFSHLGTISLSIYTQSLFLPFTQLYLVDIRNILIRIGALESNILSTKKRIKHSLGLYYQASTLHALIKRCSTYQSKPRSFQALHSTSIRPKSDLPVSLPQLQGSNCCADFRRRATRLVV